MRKLLALALLSAAIAGPARADELQRVNDRWNHAIHYQRDGQGINWRRTFAGDRSPQGFVAPAGGRGDCRAYAAAKRLDLLRHGYTPDRVAIWTAVTETGELHSLVVVDGRRVLDNRAWGVEDITVVQRRGTRFLSRCQACEEASDADAR